MEIKTLFRGIWKELFYYLGLPRLVSRAPCIYGETVFIILTYHRISPSLSKNGYISVPSDTFEQHMRFIKNNFRTVSIRDGLRALEENKSSGVYVAVNLDDGYMDNYLYAYPVLKKYSVPATIFLTTDFIGKDHAFWWDRVFNIVSSIREDRVKIDIDSETVALKLDGALQRRQTADYINSILRKKNLEEIGHLVGDLERQYLSKSDIKKCQMLGWEEITGMDRNLISFGSHTKTHRNLCLLDDDEIYRELVESKNEIEKRLGREISEFSYPFGEFDNRVKRIVHEAGFTCARTTVQGLNYKDTDRFLLSYIGGDYLFKASHLAARISSSLHKQKRSI